MQSSVFILSTKLLPASLITEAAAKDIVVDELAFIEIKDIIDEVLARQIISLAGQSVTVVFTSSNAVNTVAHQLEKDKLQPNWEIFCLSGITKTTINNYFINSSVVGEADNSGDLANVIIQHKKQAIVFFCGDVRRDELPNKLRESNIIVNEIVVYQTTETPHQISKLYDGILFFSPSAVHSFFSLNEIKEIVLFAIGNTTAKAVEQYVGNKIVISDKPEKEAVLAKAMEYFKLSKV